jgi:PhnB protein
LDGDGFHFYASDNDDAEPMRGSAQMLSFTTGPSALVMFDRLADGGTVTSPIGRYPWSMLYGKLTDRFGVQWMVTMDA